MILKDINDPKLQQYLGGKISIDDLASRMTGREIYHISNGNVVLSSSNVSNRNIDSTECRKYRLQNYFKGYDVGPREVVLATVCKEGPKYRREHVIWFLEQACVHIKTPFRFVSLTNCNDVPGKIPLEHNWPGWWSKMELFRPGIFHDNEIVLYLDLDTVFTKDYVVPDPAPNNDLFMVKFGDSWFSKFGSGIMIWKSPFNGIYDWFRKDPDRIMNAFASDQEAIISFVINRGGSIRKADNAEVQKMHGSEWIPEVRPASAIFFTAGTGLKPWDANKNWIPKFNPNTSDINDMALVTTWFGNDPLRLSAARSGAKKLCSLPEKINRMVLVELVDEPGKTKIPEWTRERAEIVASEGFKDIWQKECLMNIGARHVLRKYPEISKLVFPDIDVYPAPGWDRVWGFLTSKALDRYEVLQPWRTCSEDSLDDYDYRSFGWLSSAGARNIYSGQGFCTAMTAKFFVNCGGFPDMCLSGSGDVMTILRMSNDNAHSRNYCLEWGQWKKNVANYSGPKTSWGWLPCEMLHASHGLRNAGGAGYRCYYHRNHVWELVDGVDSVLEKNDVGMWRWKDTLLAKAARCLQSRAKELVSKEDVDRVWKECKSQYGLT